MKFRGIKLAFVSIALTILISTPVLAAEKTVSVPINKEYEACEFSIETEKKGNYIVTVISPDGEEYESEIEMDNNCQLIVKDVDKGTWQVRVETPSYPVTQSPIGVSDDEPVEDGAVDLSDLPDLGEVTEQAPESEVSAEVGKVRVSVRGVSLSNYTVDDIKIAKDIVGLNMFFIDDVLNVTWDDSSVSNVSVAVTDTQTQQELGKKTVDGRSYECIIPEGTKEVTVNVAPSTSINIESANSQFTIPVPKRPDTKVLFEDLEYTNRDTTTVNIEADASYVYEFVNNGKEVMRSDNNGSGNLSFEIPIVENDNNLICYIVDEKGNKFSTSKLLIRDSVEPIISTDSNYDGAETYDEVVKFSGRVSDYSQFFINNKEVEVSDDGVYIYEYTLHEGVNTIEFKAVDIAGNEAVINAAVTMLIKEEKPFPIIPVASIAIILIGGLGYLYYQYKTAGNGRYNNMIDNQNQSFFGFVISFLFGRRSSEKPRKERKEKISTPKAPKKGMKGWQNDLLFLALFAIVVTAFFKLVLSPGMVPSESMDPTLEVGDRVFVNRLAYILHEPQRGDIITFKSAEKDEILVKRVIGLPGDTISFANGYVYINGTLAYEDYIDPNIETNCADEFTVPEGAYFVMGDNRENSYDSRFFVNPYVSKDAITGKLFCKLYNTATKTGYIF